MNKNLKALASIEADTASKLLMLAADVALVIDEKEIVRDLTVSSDALAREESLSGWVGRKWSETVTVESRPKIKQIFQDAETSRVAQWRQVNHPTRAGKPDLPVRYAALRIGGSKQFLAVGRELRSQAMLQQRLVEAQQSVEREYARVRYAETRYRLLFQSSGEPVIILDAGSLRIVEANPAAIRVFDLPSKRIVGKIFPELFETTAQSRITRTLDALRSAGRMEELSIEVPGRSGMHELSGGVFKQDSVTYLLMRLSAGERAQSAEAPRQEVMLRSIVEKMPDAFVVTDLQRRVQSANPAFLDLAELASIDQARGEMLDRWIGRSDTELQILASSLKDRGAVSNFSTILRGELGGVDDIEISAVAQSDGEAACIGFVVRLTGRRKSDDAWLGHSLPSDPSQLTGLIGQMPLKSIVRETTDLIERMCIEAALQIVGDNRASAAEMLGLSRQSLYMKLRRFGIGDLDQQD